MKRILLVALLIGIIIVSVGLVNTDSSINDKMLDPNQTTIEWTAYKTTDKLPVKGIFKEVSFKNSKPGNDLRTALANTKFDIPIDSLYSGSSLRDGKITKSFFGTMLNTKSITGSISIKNDSEGVANITMNGITFGLPFKYTVVDGVFTLTSVLNLDNWKAQKAVQALNDDCEDLHTGPDGVTLTWSEVALTVKTQLKP